MEKVFRRIVKKDFRRMAKKKSLGGWLKNFREDDQGIQGEDDEQWSQTFSEDFLAVLIPITQYVFNI